MNKDNLTDMEVELEIEQLRNSEAVKLARAEQRHKYRQRQRLYTLRWLEKRGQELMKLGISENDFRDMDAEDEPA